MKILYVIGESQYDSVAIFLKEMAAQMTACGWEVFFLDGRCQESYAVQRECVVRERFDVIFTVNGMLLEEDSTLGKQLLKNDVLYCTYLMDHPMIHYERLKNPYPRILVLSPDRNHVSYIDTYLKHIMAAFLPHGGCKCVHDVPYQDRQYDMTFLGSYHPPEKVWEEMQTYPPQMRMLLEEAAKTLVQHTERTLEDVVWACFTSRGISLQPEEFAGVLAEFRAVDRYARSFFRDRVIRTLTEQGVRVDVFGDGWQNFQGTGQACLRVHPRVGYKEALEITGDSRISLNVMPWFKDGAHDRVFSAMRCGAVCLTDGSGWLTEVLQEERDVCFYSLKGLRYLPRKVARVLAHPAWAEQLAARGQMLAQEKHTWACRAAEVMDALEQVLRILQETQDARITEVRDICGKAGAQKEETAEARDICGKAGAQKEETAEARDMRGEAGARKEETAEARSMCETVRAETAGTIYAGKMTPEGNASVSDPAQTAGRTIGRAQTCDAGMLWRDLIRPQTKLLRQIDQVVRQLHRQEYLYAMRGMTAILGKLEQILPVYRELGNQEKGFSIPATEEEILMALQTLCQAQEAGDYVLLADLLEGQWVPFLTGMQEQFACLYPQAFREDAGEERGALEPVVLPAGYRLERTSCGAYTLAAERQGQWIYMHSNDNPYREAGELAASWFDGEHFAYIVYGLGLGYHVQALLALDELISVQVLEEDETMLSLAQTFGALRNETYQDRLQIIIDPNFQKLSEISAQKSDCQFVVHYPSLLRIRQDAVRRQLEEWFIGDCSARTQSVRLHADFWKNQSGFAHEVTELAGQFMGQTVYIIAAGPSLDQNMMELKRVHGRGKILATGTVLKKLLAADIRPDFVIITDSGKATYPQTAGITECDVPLLYLSTVYYRIPAEYPGEKYVIYQEGFAKSEAYAGKCGCPVYGTGGSVTTTALELCIRMKCRRVVFVGLDLAYPGGRNHASQTADVRDGMQGNLTVRDIYGQEIPTAKNLNLYRTWIERRIREKDAAGIAYIDATEGGARIAGTRIQSLRETVAEE